MAKQVFAFAEFTFESDTGTLRRKNRSLPLSEQPARLLNILLTRANTLVSREELRQALWPEDEFLDYDQGINVAVNRLRNALREDSRNPQFVKTIPKRGYSFCGEVRLISVESPHLPAAPRSPEPETRLTPAAVLPPPAQPVASPLAQLRSWPFRVAIALALIAAVAAIATIIVARRAPKPAAAHILRLGIAPIRVHGESQPTDLGEGLRLTLSDVMSKLPNVQVPAAGAFGTSSASEIPRISRELNLDDLLLGSIGGQGDQYDLKFELVRASDATHLASFEYSAPRKDFPTICERLQQDVFHYLRSDATNIQTVKGSTNDAQAYELYLQGTYHIFERDKDSLKRAIDEFHEATVRDPNFAAAYAGVATAYLKLGAYDTDPSNGLLAKAEVLAQRAVRLDPLLAQAHAVVGSTAYKQDRDFSRGEAELREAIRLDPTQAAYRDWLSVLLVEEGRFDEALQQLSDAQNNAPFLPSVYAMEGFVGVYARHNETALAAAKKYTELLPNLPIAHNTMAWVYFDTGHYKEAVAEWRQMALLQNDQPRIALETKGIETLRTKGIQAYAELRLDAIRDHRGIAQVNDFMPAEWYACAGHRDQALADLERLAAAHDPYMLHVAVDPLYDSFHQEPRFIALLAREGLSIPHALQGVNAHLCATN